MLLSDDCRKKFCCSNQEWKWIFAVNVAISFNFAECFRETIGHLPAAMTCYCIQQCGGSLVGNAELLNISSHHLTHHCFVESQTLKQNLGHANT